MGFCGRENKRPNEQCQKFREPPGIIGHCDGYHIFLGRICVALGAERILCFFPN